jgi:hypothetical protein
LADDVAEAMEHVVEQRVTSSVVTEVEHWAHSEGLQASHEVLVDSYQIFKSALCKALLLVEDLLIF